MGLHRRMVVRLPCTPLSRPATPVPICLRGTVEEGRHSVNTVLLLVALICGLLTLVFILNGLRTLRRGDAQLGRRGLMISLLLSLLTILFTIWNLVQTLQQL